MYLSKIDNIISTTFWKTLLQRSLKINQCCCCAAFEVISFLKKLCPTSNHGYQPNASNLFILFSEIKSIVKSDLLPIDKEIMNAKIWFQSSVLCFRRFCVRFTPIDFWIHDQRITLFLILHEKYFTTMNQFSTAWFNHIFFVSKWWALWIFHFF